MTRYYLRKGSRVTGPFDLDQLKAMRRRNQLARFHQVSPDGRTWEPATSIAEVFRGDSDPAPQGRPPMLPSTRAETVPSSPDEGPRTGPGWRWPFGRRTAATDPSSMPRGDPPAPLLFEHPDYQVLGKLPGGGMGDVFHVRNRLTGRDEVIKVIAKHIVDRPGVRARFMAEIESAERLQPHPNIVAAHAVVHLGDGLAFSMEYVRGEDLDRVLNRCGRLPVGQACDVARQAAVALQHAHSRGIIHRDIKPANLMLCPQGHGFVVKVLDFGLAKAIFESPGDMGLTHHGAMIGTPDYVAPEQVADARKVDFRADIYSLGCTLYHLLSGHPPFPSVSLYETLQGHTSANATPLDRLRADVPPALAAVVARMMAKDPAGRHQSLKEVTDALTPFSIPPPRGPSPCGEPTPVQPFPQEGNTAKGATVVEPSFVPASEPAARRTIAERRWETLVERRGPHPKKAGRRASGWAPAVLAVIAAAFLTAAVVIWLFPDAFRSIVAPWGHRPRFDATPIRPGSVTR